MVSWSGQKLGNPEETVVFPGRSCESWNLSRDLGLWLISFSAKLFVYNNNNKNVCELSIASYLRMFLTQIKCLHVVPNTLKAVYIFCCSQDYLCMPLMLTSLFINLCKWAHKHELEQKTRGSAEYYPMARDQPVVFEHIWQLEMSEPRTIIVSVPHWLKVRTFPKTKHCCYSTQVSTDFSNQDWDVIESTRD